MIGRESYRGYDEVYSPSGGYSTQPQAAVHGPTSWMGELDWLGLRQEVEAEARAEIILLGLGNAGKSTLFNSLRGWPVTLTALKLGKQVDAVEERMGLFTLIDLPENGDPQGDMLLERLEQASLLVYMLDGAVGAAQGECAESVVRPADCRWIGRLQSTGRPLLVALSKADLWNGQQEIVVDSLQRRLGVEVMPVSAYDSSEAQSHFLARMVESCPKLAVPLGREVAAFRRAAAKRVICRAALLCGLVAMEPIPLVDLPIQIGTQVGLVARIATMYGHPPSSDYAKELLVTGAGSAALRLLALQAAKFIPVFGWAASGALGAMATWLVGHAAMAYFEGDVAPSTLKDRLTRRWPVFVRSQWPSVLAALRPQRWWAWIRQRGIRPCRRAAVIDRWDEDGSPGPGSAAESWR